MESENALGVFLKKVHKATEAKISALKETRAAGQETDTSEEEIVNKTKEYFIPLLRNLAKKAGELTLRSTQNAISLEAVETAMNQLRKEHMDLWKSFSALLAKYASMPHPDSSFLEKLLHDYDLRRSYVDELVKERLKSSSISISSSRLIIKDFADRFGVFWEQINNYIKEKYTQKNKEFDKKSPLYILIKGSQDFRDFFKIYKEYKEIKDTSEGVTSGIRSIRYDFEDIIETVASLENEFIEKLGYYVMFYDEEEKDFHGFTRDLFKEFSVRMKRNSLPGTLKLVTDPNLQEKAKKEFDLIWRRIVPKDMVALMDKPPIEIVFAIMEKKTGRW